jgi:carboxypeptidase PM20D1
MIRLLKLLRFSALFVLLLLAVMLVKTFLSRSTQVSAQTTVQIQSDTAALQHLAQMSRFRTVSYDDSVNGFVKLTELKRLYEWLKTTYPNVAQLCHFRHIGQSLLIEYRGTQPQLKPALFLAHLDVVPASDSADWIYAPFAGTVKNDTLWGRGTLDDKNVAVALLEALEKTLISKKLPRRSILLAFGHDEESGGVEGAAQIAAYLKKNNISAEFIADEGFGVMEGIVPGLESPCAMIGLAEKGNVTLKLSVKMAAGHSAWPKSDNASAVLSRGLGRLENEEFNARIDGPVRELFETIAPHMNFGYRFLFSNLWITSPLVKSVLLKGEKTAASIRTTHVTTIIRSGDKDNVVPANAEAFVNFRLKPGHRIADLKKEVEQILGDSRIAVTLHGDFTEATPVSPTHHSSYNTLSRAIRTVFPDAVVAPALTITGTDCKHYTHISDCIYRFAPFRLGDSNLAGIHGKNEHISNKQLSTAIAFYRHLFGLL